MLGAAEAALLEHYLDTVEHLPDDVQRTISQLREIDQQYQHVLGELEWMICENEPKKYVIQRGLVRAQELADDKLHLMQQLIDSIDNKSRQLDVDARNLDKLNRHHSPQTTFDQCLATSKATLLERQQPSPLTSVAGHSSDDNNSNQNVSNNTLQTAPNNGATKHKDADNSQGSSGGNAGQKRARRAAAQKDYAETNYAEKREKRSAASTGSNKGCKRASSETGHGGKKRKSQRQQEVASPVEAIDPDEPTYCLCEQVSFGEMICCDNEECTIEWFHFQCVALTTKPKGKWYCPKCRGDRSNQMKKTS